MNFYQNLPITFSKKRKNKKNTGTQILFKKSRKKFKGRKKNP